MTKSTSQASLHPISEKTSELLTSLNATVFYPLDDGHAARRAPEICQSLALLSAALPAYQKHFQGIVKAARESQMRNLRAAEND